MYQIIISLSTWLHSLATILFIGHHLLLVSLYLPAVAETNAGGAVLSAISKRSRPWMYLSLLVFFLTGTHLTLVNSSYLGLGNFGNPWAILMLVKHLLILVMIGLGFWFNGLLRVGPRMSGNTGAEDAMQSFGYYARLMSISGLLVLLLTALAQVK